MHIRKLDDDLKEPDAPVGIGEVRVFLSTPEWIHDAPGLTSVLSDADRAHIERFHFDIDRDVACASRVLQRLALSRCASVSPESWHFTAEPRQKPRISGPASAPPLEFSVANTRGLVACAVTTGRRVGVDVERDRADLPVSVVRRCWSHTERTQFESLPPEEQCRRFADVWTAKEAYAKALGLGLALDLQLVGIEVVPVGYRLDLDTRLHENGTNWALAVWKPRPSHTLALCVEGDDQDCRVTTQWIGAASADRL